MPRGAKIKQFPTDNIVNLPKIWPPDCKNQPCNPNCIIPKECKDLTDCKLSKCPDITDYSCYPSHASGLGSANRRRTRRNRVRGVPNPSPASNPSMCHYHVSIPNCTYPTPGCYSNKCDNDNKPLPCAKGSKNCVSCPNSGHCQANNQNFICCQTITKKKYCTDQCVWESNKCKDNPKI